MHKGKKILVGPCEVAGYYRNLCEGFRQLGVPYDFITYQSHPSGYGGETRRPVLLRMARWFQSFHEKPSRSWITKVFGALPSKVLVCIWVAWAIYRYDVFIFGFGMSWFKNNRDLPILRALGKTVIANLAHGSEARPPYIDGFFQSKEGEITSADKLKALALRNKQCVVRHEKYCDVVIGAPFSTTQFASRRLLNTFALGIPFQSAEPLSDVSVRQQTKVGGEHAVRILHAPSNPIAKGTSLIISAIENLKARGYRIDFVLIHGRPFKEVMEAVQHCDFVIDQLYCDTPMAGFATESAWFGKPAVVCGYGLDRLRLCVPNDMWPPSKTCLPNEVEQAIEFLIVNRDERMRLGIAAQMFVREKWSASEVAKKYLRIVEGTILDEWWINPHTVSYLEGAGQSVERTCKSIQLLLQQYGAESLQLSHRPELEQDFLSFSGVVRR